MIGIFGSSAYFDISPMQKFKINNIKRLHWTKVFLLNKFVETELKYEENVVARPIKAENSLDINKSSVMSLNILLE